LLKAEINALSSAFFSKMLNGILTEPRIGIKTKDKL